MRKRHVFTLLILLAICFILIINLVTQMRSSLFPGLVCLSVCQVPAADVSSVHLQRQSVRVNRNTGPCSDGQLLYGYCALNFWRTAARTDTHNNQVTLCTQGTPEFLHHVFEVCSRWTGPISLAVYCQNKMELQQAARKISKMRACNKCIHTWVDWHLFFDISNGIPRLPADQVIDDCTVSKETSHEDRIIRNGTYPINVARNLALRNAKTTYIFPSDIELYPSQHVLRRFELLLAEKGYSPKDTGVREVFVLPVFEVWSKYKVPETKENLRQMYKKKQAISFHRYRCDICHKIPRLMEWLNYGSVDGAIRSEIRPEKKPLTVWRTVRRNSAFKLQYWEPFFIGRKDIPEFDIRLSWEGKQNKMQMAYEMCLLNYDFHILDEAFLVHAPGVNIYKASKEKFRMKQVIKNAAVMKNIVKELSKKYNRSRAC